MLASPIINGTLPAFYAKEDGTATIAVPFSMSRAVNKNEISGFKLKIRNIQGSVYSDSLSATNSSNIDYNEGIVNFILTKEQVQNFVEGAFYKVQIAYVDLKGIVGYYSTVGVIKFTTKPEVYILNLESFDNNFHFYNYTGVYSQEGKDATEKVYSYRFILKDEDNNILQDTGELIHNNSNDVEYYESQDEVFFNMDLESGKKYKLTYMIETNNGLKISSPTYKIIKKNSINSTLKAEIKTSLNYENGYIQISLDGEKDKTGNEIPVKGSFILSRSSEKNNYQNWEEILKFNLVSQRPSIKSFEDFTIEQGIKYKYSIQQYNAQGLYSERIISEEIYADFEHCFLFDGKRQLKIKFNPKVSSFKTDLLEAKIDTIGSKYPFIFRNGNVEYKEFPISGLISYLSDEEGLFIDNQELFEFEEKEILKLYKEITFKNFDYNDFLRNYYNLYEYNKILKEYQPIKFLTKKEFEEKYSNNKTVSFYTLYTQQKNKKDLNKVATTNLISNNISLEREFKLQVLDWLNNGQPKLFKSPNEGNYLVRLMNISFSPEDTLGRMLHNFSATAYEIADFNYENLIKYNMINSQTELEETYLKFTTIPLMTTDANYAKISPINFVQEKDSNIYYASGELIKVGAIIENLILTDMLPGSKIILNGEPIIIGSTGTYISPIKVESLQLESKSTGSLTIGYYTQMNGVFNTILETKIKNVIGKQFIGKHTDIIAEIENIESEINRFYNINFYSRPIQEAYMVEGYDVVPIDEVYYWCDSDSWHYGNYYVLNDNNEYVPASGVYDDTDVYYSKELFLYNQNGEIIWNKSVYNKNPEEFANDTSSGWCQKPDIFRQYINDFNPLEVYKYTIWEDDIYGKRLEKVNFINTAQTLKELDIKLEEATYLENRIGTNSLILDKREFKFYVEDRKIYNAIGELITNINFDENEEYYIQQPIEIIYIPEYGDIKFFTKDTYEYFKNKFQDNEELKNSLNLYSSEVYVNSNETYLNLEEIGYYNLKDMDKINIIQTDVGVYCDLSYQLSLIEYNVSKNASLTALKEILNNFNTFLSKNYLIEQCINNDNQEEYLEKLNAVRTVYDLMYKSYLIELQTYLYHLEQEG